MTTLPSPLPLACARVCSEDEISQRMKLPERERRFLGCVHVPLSAIYQMQVLEGTLRLEVGDGQERVGHCRWIQGEEGGGAGCVRARARPRARLGTRTMQCTCVSIYAQQ